MSPIQSRLLIAPDSDFPHAAADQIALEILKAVGERGSCSIALSGGATPRPVYEILARPPLLGRLPWDRLHFYFGDERCVPPDHPESNHRMAWEALFHRAAVRPERIHRIEGERADRDGAAAAYEAVLPEILDVLILGMGEDGHTASLFPGSPALDEKIRRVVPIEGPKPPTLRITITPPVIAAARSVLILATGLGKATMAAQAISGDPDLKRVPAQLARRGTWILDWEAASELDLR